MKSDSTFPQINQSSLYDALFQQSFRAIDALEDAIALRKNTMTVATEICKVLSVKCLIQAQTRAV